MYTLVWLSYLPDVFLDRFVRHKRMEFMDCAWLVMCSGVPLRGYPQRTVFDVCVLACNSSSQEHSGFCTVAGGRQFAAPEQLWSVAGGPRCRVMLTVDLLVDVVCISSHHDGRQPGLRCWSSSVSPPLHKFAGVCVHLFPVWLQLVKVIQLFELRSCPNRHRLGIAVAVLISSSNLFGLVVAVLQG